jgi:hypothetical protein
MKKLVGWSMAWLFYLIGDLVAKCINDDTGWLYPVYNHFMTWSLNSQDWSGIDGPWEKE